jgi:phage tail sheath protein FI
MAANFLHGVETIEIKTGPRPVKMVKSAVIGLVGAAPIHLVEAGQATVNELALILSDLDAVRRFGPERPGFSIPSALEAIRAQGRGVVIVVNVFDPARHKSAATLAATAFAADGTLALGHADVLSLTLTPTLTGAGAADPLNQNGPPTWVEGTDYTLDRAAGIVTRLPAGAIPAGATAQGAMEIADLTKVTAADIIGGVDAAGHRTGMQAWLDTYQLMGFFPKNLIAPGWSQLASVEAALVAIADRLRGHALIDAPIGVTVEDALAGRGPFGAIAFATSSPRAILCYPHVKRYDPATDSEVLAPLSSYIAGTMAETDVAEGYWVSPSNHEVKGITGLERRISFMINDANCEANILNEAGIVTVANSFGTGYRIWGNRSAAFPSSTWADNFISIRRTFDVIHESVEYASLQFMDQPLDLPRIDSILGTVNGLVRKLIGDGALIAGRYFFLVADNTVEELSAGHLTLRDDLTPPSPLERLTYKSRYDVNGLKALYAAAA